MFELMILTNYIVSSKDRFRSKATQCTRSAERRSATDFILATKVAPMSFAILMIASPWLLMRYVAPYPALSSMLTIVRCTHRVNAVGRLSISYLTGVWHPLSARNAICASAIVAVSNLPDRRAALWCLCRGGTLHSQVPSFSVFNQAWQQVVVGLRELDSPILDYYESRGIKCVNDEQPNPSNHQMAQPATNNRPDNSVSEELVSAKNASLNPLWMVSFALVFLFLVFAIGIVNT